MAQTVPETSLGFVRQCLAWINCMVDLGVLSTAIIGPLTTVAGLRAVSSTGVPETSLRFYEEYQLAIDRGQAVGVLTDAAVAAADTVAGLRALFTAQDATLNATDRFSLVGY